MKRNNLLYIFILGAIVFLQFSCADYLDLEPKNKITSDAVLSDPDGIKSFLANLYYQLPMEDFTYMPNSEGFNSRGVHGCLTLAQYSLEAVHSEWAWWGLFVNDCWDKGYKLNRDINLLIQALNNPEINLRQEERDELLAEASFLRAYTYFALAKRYGGVPLILELQEYSGDFESLRVPRSTEKDTWDLVLEECDKAAAKLPSKRESETTSRRRATKWAAYALKSRAALHAASLAKYWNEAPLSGEAVTQKLVGIEISEANRYYEACIKASEAIMESGIYSLYKPTPASPQEAANNYHYMFTNPDNVLEEVILSRGYGSPGGPLAYDFQAWNEPYQTSAGFWFSGRTNPVLELIDVYETYDNPGYNAPIITTTDGMLHNNGYDPALNYRKFDSPEEIFEGKDARFFGSIIFPGSLWKGDTIVIQGGLVKPDGTLMNMQGSYEHNGVKYYTFGKEFPDQYSGFDGRADVTRSGFLMKKFMSETSQFGQLWRQSVTPYMDFRLADIYLNYAEAVVESGYTQNNAQTTAAKVINDLRKRAGHTVEIPLTLENVLRERFVELSFENKHYWDLIRRRTYHQEFKNRNKLALVPLLDLRGSKPQYIFVRREITGMWEGTFNSRDYYRSIPGIGANGAVQNPQH